MSSLVIVLLGIFGVLAVSHSLPRSLRFLAGANYVLHLGGAFGQIWMHTDYYGGGDMITYFRNGLPTALLLRNDFVRWFPEVVKLWLHLPNELPTIGGAWGNAGTMQGTSGTMVGIAAFLVWFFDTPLPTWPVCFLLSAFASVGQISMFKSAISVAEDRYHNAIAYGMLLVPSVVFWSSGLLKEAVALPLLGLLLTGTILLSRKRWLPGLAAAALGALGVGLVKSYILMPFVIAVASAAYVARNARNGGGFRWSYFALALVIAAAGLAVMSSLFPEFAPTKVAETSATYQQTYGFLEDIGQGGSNIQFDTQVEVTTLGQLKNVPLALVNALFRPFFFEARSSVQLAAAMETLLIMILMYRVLRRGVAARLRAITSSPTLTFCAVFVLTFAVAVGLSTLNLGTLSRYRVPMMPFFFTLMFVLAVEVGPAPVPVKLAKLKRGLSRSLASARSPTSVRSRP